MTPDDKDTGTFVKEISYGIESEIIEIKNGPRRVKVLAFMVLDKHDLDFENGIDTREFVRAEIANGVLCLTGLIGIHDPPRNNIDKVIDKLRHAKIAMITGDFELTGLEIARDVNIVTKEVDKYSNLVDFNEGSYISCEDEEEAEHIVINKKERVRVINCALHLTVNDIDALTEFQWRNVARYAELVCTRTTPEHKLLIIKQFQKYGAIISMTGDGINDSPSLKQADVSISLVDASDIAKEISDLILVNDDGDEEDLLFNSITEDLKYSHLIFENLNETIAYLLPAGTFAELWPVLLNIIVGMSKCFPLSI